MKMKAKKYVMLGLSIFILSGCTSQSNNSGNSGIAQINGTENGSNQKTEVYEDEIKSVLKDNKLNWNDSVTIDGISYQIQNISIGKELENHNKDDINYLTDEVDENGNFLGTNRFIWMDVKIRNTGNEKKEVIVNSNNFYSISKDNVITETGAEAVYIDQDEKESNPAEHFHCDLNGGEERTITLGYWIDTRNVNGTFYYGIGNSGSSIDDVNNKFLNVEEFWNEK